MKNTLYLFSLVFISMSAQAQTTVNASGGTKVIDNNTHSYSIGEMAVVSTNSATGIIVTQGLLQPESITVGIADITISGDELKVYPNPTRDVVHLQLNMANSGDFVVYLFDGSGRELIREEYKNSTGKEQRSMDLQSFAMGNYLLRAEFRGQQTTAVQTFKIQKL